MARNALRTTPNLQQQSPRGTDFERHRSIVVLSEDARSLRRGFTIVELLIVVVVIAILAAITIVAYNGIQSRAKASAAQATAKQAFTKIAGFAIENADTYPTQAQLESLGLRNGDGTSYQYRVDNSANPRTFCLTATTQNTSYYVSTTANSPTAGACAGHGVNGGGVITNLVVNPGFENNGLDWGHLSGGMTAASSNEQAHTGSRSLKLSRTATSTLGIALNPNPYPPAAQGAPLAFSVWVYSSKATQVTLGFSYRDSSRNQLSNVTSSAFAVATGTWTRLSFADSSAPATTTGVETRVSPSGATWGSADGFFIDSAFLTGTAAEFQFADGSSPGWAWNGAPNNSTSTGPPL